MVINMNPIAFTLFDFEVRWYSIFILIGVILAYLQLMIEVKKFKMSEDSIFNMTFWTLIIGIIGARLYYVLFNWEYFGSHIGEIWQIWQGGLAIHGGIITGLITIALYCRKNDMRTIKILDMVVPGVILAQAIGRWGNFFNSEAYGAATTIEHLQSLHVPNFIIEGMHINGTYYTPTFFYESLWCVCGFLMIYIIRSRKYCKVSQATAIYLIWYGLGRFFIEASRTDSLMFLGFKIAQIVSIIMIIIGIILIVRSFKKGKFEDLYNDFKGLK